MARKRANVPQGSDHRRAACNEHRCGRPGTGRAKENRVPVPDWHREILDERLADLEANPDAGRPWEEVRADLFKTTPGKQ